MFEEIRGLQVHITPMTSDRYEFKLKTVHGSLLLVMDRYKLSFFLKRLARALLKFEAEIMQEE